jgi:hypothetical protein
MYSIVIDNRVLLCGRLAETCVVVDWWCSLLILHARRRDKITSASAVQAQQGKPRARTHGQRSHTDRLTQHSTSLAAFRDAFSRVASSRRSLGNKSEHGGGRLEDGDGQPAAPRPRHRLSKGRTAVRGPGARYSIDLQLGSSAARAPDATQPNAKQRKGKAECLGISAVYFEHRPVVRVMHDGDHGPPAHSLTFCVDSGLDTHQKIRICKS